MSGGDFDREGTNGMPALTHVRPPDQHSGTDRTIEIDAVRADIEREERLVGLRPDGFVTPVEIRHRRHQILGVMLLVFVGLAATTLANDLWDAFRRSDTWIDPGVVRIGMIVFAAGFAVYVLEKEHHLKRLMTLGRRAEELDLVLAERILMSAIVAEATETVTTSIDLEQVLAQVLHEGDRLVGASMASISLVNDDGRLEEAWTRGASIAAGRRLVSESVLLQVAVSREPFLLVGPLPTELVDDDLEVALGAAALAGAAPGPDAGGDVLARPAARSTSVSVAVIPLVRDDAVLGVLTVAALPGRRYSTDDLDVLTRLAAPAAQALANARRFEAARLQDFGGIDTRREELREIGRSIRDAAALARRDDLGRDERDALLGRIDEQAAHLLREVD